MFHGRTLARPLFLAAALTLLTGATAHAQTVVTVDAAANRHTINPNIYGVAYADTPALRALRAPLNRMGGNNTSRYNWRLNADNKGSDWFFESIGDSDSTPGARADSFVAGTREGGAAPLLTIPMIGWVAKLGPNRDKLASFLVSRYGAQARTDFWFSDAGNGVSSASSQNITGNDPNDANVPAGPLFQADWLAHLTSRWGTASGGGVPFYVLDNEPSIWHGTHRDVHPGGATMEEIRDDILAYAGKIKDADASAQTIGPEEWGWSGYFYSGYDQQWGGAHGWGGTLPDKAAHENAEYLPWLLAQLRQNETATGRRLLDIFSVHFYPQSGEFSDDVSTNMQRLRNRSTRQLWDANYVSESWISDRVQLIPRLKNWVANSYPGTKTAITEYNWGAEGHINGATTQADIFGIFGREGLDMAARWTTPGADTPTFKAMQLYRNYDSANSGFGEICVSALAPDPDTLSAFAAVRNSDGALTVMVVSKDAPGDVSVQLNLSHFAVGGAAQAWQVAAANTLTHLAEIPVRDSRLTTTVPAQSVTLFVVPAAPTPATLTVSPARVTGSVGATGTVTLNRAAPADGLSVALTSSGEAAAIPASVTVAAGQTRATFAVTTRAVAADTTLTLSARAGDVTQTTTLTVAAPLLGDFTLQPTPVASGLTTQAVATLSGPAPSGGASVVVTSGAATLGQIAVATGQTRGTLMLTAGSPGVYSVRAAYRGGTRTTTLTVTAPVLTNFVFDPARPRAGQTTRAVVTLSARAPAPGVLVRLASGTSAWAVTVAAGQTTGTLTMTTGAPGTFTVTATDPSGVRKTATLVVTP